MSDNRKDFDETYVKKLREEAASWRTKCRELETQTHEAEVSKELMKQGVNANPNWVSVEEGQSVEDAVKNLVSEHPHLQQKDVEIVEPMLDFDSIPSKPTTPKPLRPSTQGSNNPKPHRETRISSRNIEEIRKDPQARAKVRDFYRELLKSKSNQQEI